MEMRESENKAVIDALEEAFHEPVVLGDLPREFPALVAVPRGGGRYDVLDFTEKVGNLEAKRAAKEKPERLAGFARLDTLESLVAWAKRFAGEPYARALPEGANLPDAIEEVSVPMAVLFADEGETRLTTIINYPGFEAPAYADHRGIYTFPLSQEWAAWHTAQCWMEQESFAELIESRITDVVDGASAPASAKKVVQGLGIEFAEPGAVLALSQGLSVNVESKVKHHRNLSSGQGEISFVEEHRDDQGQQLRVPRAMLIGIPVFQGGPRWSVPVLIRYRVREGKVVWRLDLYRTDVILRDAFREACQHAAGETGLPLFYGKPESIPAP